MPCMSAVLLGTLMYRSGLVPRAIPLIVLIGAPLLITSTIAVLFGVIGQISAWTAIATAPCGPVGALAGSVDDLQGLPAFPHHNWNGGSRHPADHPRRRPRLATST